MVHVVFVYLRGNVVTELVVSTFFWQDPDRKRDYQFTHDHVRILRNMVGRHLTIPHRFVCVTDDKIDDIETIPLDWSKHLPGTCFIRLMQRRPDYGDLIKADRVLNLDIDMVLVDCIDSLVDRPEPSVWWRNPNFPAPRRAYYQTSIQLFTPGSHSELWEEFDVNETPKWVNWRFGGAEPAGVSEALPWNLPQWDHRDGIYGAGRLGGAGIGSKLPANAKIVSFPGNRMMDQKDVIERHPWIEEFWK